MLALALKDASIELLVRVPTTAYVKLGRSDRSGANADAHLHRAPNVLVLEHRHVQELITHGLTELASARRGYVQYPDGSLRPAAPPQNADDRLNYARTYARDHGFRAWDHWVVSSGSKSRRPLEFAVTDLRITKEMFGELLQQHYLGPKGERVAWVSTELKLAIEAAKEHWGRPGVNAIDKLTHPSAERIVSWLVSKNVSKDAAERIEQIIRPDIARRKRPQKVAGVKKLGGVGPSPSTLGD